MIIGTESLMSSGVASRSALYDASASWRNVGPGGSKQTAMWVGFSFLRSSSREFTKPNTAEVLKPSCVVRGIFMRA